jgi:hypothetical protein
MRSLDYARDDKGRERDDKRGGIEMTKGGGEMTRRGIVINHLNLNHYD